MNTTNKAGNKAQMMNGNRMQKRNGELKMTGRHFTLRAGYWSGILLMMVGLLLGLNESAQAGTAVNTYGTIASAAGPLLSGGANQTVATVPVTLGSGGVTVTSYTVTLGGTVTAGQVTSVTVTGGGTWSATGSYGTGSVVVCSGAAVKPATTISIQVTLAAGTAGKTVSVQLTTDSNAATSLPTGVSTALSITDPPLHNLTSFTNNAPSTANPDATTKYLFATIASAAANGGTDVSAWSVTVNDNGTTLTPSAVTVFVEYGGVDVGSGSPVAIGTAFSIAAAGTQNGGSDWTFRVMLAGAADTKSIQLSINSATGGTLAGAALPKTAPAAAFTTITTVTGLTCSGCHANPPTDGTRSAATGSVAGDHAKHVTTYGYTCNICHVDSSAYTSRHRNGNIQVISPIGALLNARYDKNNNHIVDATDTSWAQTPTPGLGKCENTACHGGVNSATSYGGPTGVGPTWGTSTSSTCTFCHNRAKIDSGVNADAYPTTASPFRSTTAVGAHAQHLTATSGLISGGVLCADCHTVPGTVGAAGHLITNYAAPADLTFSAKASLNSTTASYGTGTCTVYCHGTNMPGGDTSGTNEVNTSWTATWTNYPTGCTAACHGLPPTTGTSASTHSGQAFPTSCISCHADTITSTANPPGINATFHINGIVEASGCTGCHGTDPKQYPPLSKWGANRSTADGVGAHVAHIEATATYMTKEAVAGESNITDYWCAECHTTTRGAGGHNDGYPGEVAFTNAVESKYNGHIPSRTVEADNNPDLGNGTTCSVYCHGASMPYGDTLGTTRTPAWGVTLSGCNPCHGFPPTPTGTHSGVTLGTQCGGCHLSTMTNGNAAITNTANHINGTLEVTVTCTGCHTGSGGGAKNVGPNSSHTDPDGAGTTYAAGGNHCAVCHHSDHAAETTNTIAVTWDPRTMGTNYTTGDFKIHLKKLSGTETSEAEICWNCHSGSNMASISPKPAEFGGTQGAYQTGTLTVSSTDATPRWNWYTGYWRSANFAYKNLAINNATPGGSVHEAATVYTADPTIVTTISAANVTKIGCSSCHDVHRLGNNGYTPTGAPYLRGTWVSNPFKEDGAPLAAHTFTAGTYRGTAPRAAAMGNLSSKGVPVAGSTTNNQIGGWQIEQNNGALTGWTSYAASASLCVKCHSGEKIRTAWGAHAAVVPTLGNTTAYTAANIFRTSTRRKDASTTATSTYRTGNIGHWGVNATASCRDTAGYVGGLRASGFTGLTGATPADAGKPEMTGLNATTTVYPYGTQMTINDGTTDTNFHRFSCSKCHSPHASRLPRLMITNCLDVKKNTWDDAKGNPNTWGTANGATYTAKQLAYSPTANNCHRYVSGTDANREANAEAGWNTVTPW